MKPVIRAVLITFIWFAPLASAAVAQPASGARSRVVVTLKSSTDFAPFESEFVGDRRTTGQFAYHSHAVVGAVMSLERRHGFIADAFFSRALQGFAAALTPGQIEALARNPMVERIEADTPLQVVPITIAAQVVDWGIPKIHADISSTRSGDGTGTVTGVNVYVIDSGVDATNPDLNVVNHVNFYPGEANTDCNGHGTSVAGVIAAKDNGDDTVGVAPGAPVTGVKVVGCQGLSWPSFIIAGIDWVTANAVKPAVANMSLGTLIPILALNTAVQNSAASGVFYALAAGNGNPFNNDLAFNACYNSPGGAGYNRNGVPNGIVTAAATDSADQEASFSNYGVCVDMWAPGVGITILSLQGGTRVGSGTSFSSPYTAGAAALLLSQYPFLNPPSVEYVLLLTAEATGTFSKDGTPIKRLSVFYW